MPSHRKKRVGHVNDDDDDNEISDESMEQEVILVDFEAKNLEDSDFHGIRRLLQQLFLKSHVDLSELTDTLISQNYIGSIIKQSEDVEVSEDEDDDVEDVLGLISVINLTERKNLACVQQMKALLLSRCPGGATGERLAAVLDDASRSVGFVISERFINIPPQIAVPSYTSLWSEIEQAVKKKMNYNFAFYVMICKTCRLPDVVPPGGKANNSADVQRLFINAEEELFYEESTMSYDYSVSGERDSVMGSGDWGEDEDEMEPLRTVILLSAADMQRALAAVSDTYSLPAAATAAART